jgi:hypothetical protein
VALSAGTLGAPQERLVGLTVSSGQPFCFSLNPTNLGFQGKPESYKLYLPADERRRCLQRQRPSFAGLRFFVRQHDQDGEIAFKKN